MISQNGAATANLMFCKKGATFVGLTTNNPAVNSSYFPNLAKALGVRFEQLAFKATFSSLIHPAHLDFEVDLNEIKSLLTKDLGLSPLKIGE